MGLLGKDPGKGGPGQSRSASRVAACLAVVGLVARASSFADRGRLLRQFPTEDGYLMLTIARNIALGRGMSTADGTMPTNGTQPLATFLWSVCSLAVGGDKVGTVATVLVVQLLLATTTAWVIYRLARRILPPGPASRDQAMLAAAGWYASATVVSHSMNCLESGLYVLLVALLLLFVLGPTVPSAPRYRHWASVGALLGVAFWARNDAVLFCVALAVVHLLWGLPGAPRRRMDRFAELAVAGAVVTCIAAPWLVFNKVRFGHVMPISGQSESIDVVFGANAVQVAPVVLTYLTMFLPVPNTLLRVPAVAAVSVVAVGVYVALTWRSVRGEASSHTRTAWRLAAVATLVLAAFYGLLFGAPHFMSRYFLALSPFYAVAWGAAVQAALSRLQRASPVPVAVGALVLVALPVALNLRTYRHGTEHPHFQVIEWVRANLPESTWVAAPQSGTLGYFHDRTVNLDGKVNPAALQARLSNKVAQYVVESDIPYVADWEVLASPTIVPGAALSMGSPGAAQAFDVLVDDRERNLAVLERKAR